MVIVWGVPNAVQVLPSGEIEPVKLLPLRSIFTQYGAATTAPVLSLLVETPSAVSRRWKLAPLPAPLPPGVMGMKAWVEPALDALADHDTALGPDVAVADALDAGDHRAVAGESLIGKAELVGVVPDVRADGVHQHVAGGQFHKARACCPGRTATGCRPRC